MKKISHSKIKNPFLIFEVLAKQVTVDILQNIENSHAIKIIKEFFANGTELNKELNLYNTLLDNNEIKEKNKANDLIHLVIEYRKKLNEESLNIEKYNIIKAIKEHYDVDSMFNSRMKNYKGCAAVYKTFKNAIDNKDYNPTDVVQSHHTIIENLILPVVSNSKDISQTINDFKNQDEEIRLLSHKILIEKFNKKYGELDEYQKTLLKEYINNLSNSSSLKKYLKFEIPKVQEILNEFIEYGEDKVLNIKLNEINHQIGNISNGKIVKDKHLVALLKTYELIRKLTEAYQK
jgi:hypothetical protein